MNYQLYEYWIKSFQVYFVKCIFQCKNFLNRWKYKKKRDTKKYYFYLTSARNYPENLVRFDTDSQRSKRLPCTHLGSSSDRWARRTLCTADWACWRFSSHHWSPCERRSKLRNQRSRRTIRSRSHTSSQEPASSASARSPRKWAAQSTTTYGTRTTFNAAPFNHNPPCHELLILLASFKSW